MASKKSINISTKKNIIQCYHCGDDCEEIIKLNEIFFCCNGCLQVYLLLSENNLCNYYGLDIAPGIKVKGKLLNKRFEYLDDPDVSGKLLHFASENLCNVVLSLPQVHCSSCIYLLENLHRIDQGIITSRCNFQKKEIFVSYDPARISLRKVVELLAFIGYEPAINAGDAENNDAVKSAISFASYSRNKIYKIGVAGFCFSNIMMLSFPEYFSSGHIAEHGLRSIFTWLNFALSLPVLFFSASSIFSTAWKGLRQKHLNIDLPIALAIIVTFSRSYYEIISGHGAGYLDSGTGIIFFMLIGRWFQDKTYESLSFDRDYRSFLPMGVTVINGEKETNIPVSKLKIGDRIIIRNGEMIPADAVLINGNAGIDYSFISGENIPLQKKQGDLLYAGGRQTGNAIQLQIIKGVSQSYITELWNNDVFHSAKNRKESFIHPWSRYFTIVLLAIALSTALFWFIVNPSNILPAVTAVLIVACPCSLLLSATFTYGNMLRIFGKNKFYLKNAGVIETLASVDDIVFDKTGTLTEPQKSLVTYSGIALTENERELIWNISNQSLHPLSKLLAANLKEVQRHVCEIEQFEELAGQGVSAFVNGKFVRLGSPGFMNDNHVVLPADNIATQIYIKIDENNKGFFSIKNQYRPGVKNAIESITRAGYHTHVLSGDNASEKEKIQNVFGKNATIKFYQSPLAKLEFIQHLQGNNRKVMMVGDGINDSGALRQADIGISVNNNDSRLTPACDGILEGESINKIHRFLKFAKAGKKIVTASFILSILYNVAGLSFAVSGHLQPMVAAILMPVSSISIVLFVSIASNVSAKRNGL